MRRIRAAAFRTVLSLGLAAAAIAAAAPSEPLTAPIRVDVVVTDAKGRPILDLRPGDFELRENGVLRTIAGVELRTSRAAPADPSPILSERDEEAAARQPGARVFAFFLDEFHVSPGAPSERVRSALTEFIDSALQPGDLALVVKPGDALTALRFTRDRAAQRATVGSFAGRKGDYAPRNKFESDFIGRAPAAVEAARTQIATAVLRELAAKMGDLRADRGVLVVVSEGFLRNPPPVRGARMPDLQGVVRAASRYNLSMYAFNPSDRPAEVPVVGPTSRDVPVSTLQFLASQTGGQAILDGQDLVAGLKQMSEDLSGYYVLTYQSDQTDGRYHRLEVRANRRDALVRTPPGFWAPLASEWRTAASSATKSSVNRRELRRSPMIDVWTGVTRDVDGRARMSLTWEPRRNLDAPRLLRVRAQTTAGRALFEGTVAFVGAAGGQPERVAFDVPAGRVELDLTVLGLDGRRIDGDTRDVEVPAVDARATGPVLMTPEVIRARNARERNAEIVNPDSTPTPDRTFTRSDRLLVRVPVFEGSGGPVRVTASILNRWGQAMRDLAETPAVPGLIGTQFDLPLAWLAPGDYLIAITAQNPTGKTNDRVTISVR